MYIPNAEIVDVLRCSQKDEQFTDLYTNRLIRIVRLCSTKFQNKLINFVHPLIQFLYYYLTSLTNLQTLGEEYTGLIRYNRQNKDIPSKWIHSFWLVLFIGGDSIFNNALKHFAINLKNNHNLRNEAKLSILNWINLFKHNKDLIIKLHQALFYLDGNYYFIPNRLAKIKYIFVQYWINKRNSSKTINLLGRISLAYLFTNTLYKMLEYKNEENKDYSKNNKDNLGNNTDYSENIISSSQECFLCSDIKSNNTAISCGHSFCWNCIFISIVYEAKCPICREFFDKSRIVWLQNI